VSQEPVGVSSFPVGKGVGGKPEINLIQTLIEDRNFFYFEQNFISWYLQMGAGVMFDWTFFDNSKLIKFD
jgi:hypothetical protein